MFWKAKQQFTVVVVYRSSKGRVVRTDEVTLDARGADAAMREAMNTGRFPENAWTREVRGIIPQGRLRGSRRSSDVFDW